MPYLHNGAPLWQLYFFPKTIIIEFLEVVALFGVGACGCGAGSQQQSRKTPVHALNKIV